MDTRKSMIWIGAAMLVVAALTATLVSRKDDPPVQKPAGESDLFPFLRPFDSSALNAPAPAPVPVETMPTPTDIANVEATVQNMRAQGAGEDEIHRLRAAALSPETADRLAEQGKAEKAWNARVNAYLAERERLRESALDVTDAQRSYALQQLRDSRFTVEEQTQLATYETSPTPQLVE